jgi:ankyrin repeat protein
MDRAAIRMLLQQRGDVNAPQVDGATALHWAAYNDDLETAGLLVRAGANVKAANRYGVTPLSLACTNGNGAMVDLLLKAGADANTSLPGGETALMTAARTGKVEPINALLSRGADVNAKESGSGQNALMWAAAEGNLEAVEAVIKAGADFRLRLNSGFTPLLIAARDGQSGVVKALLKAGAIVSDTIQTGPPVQKATYVYDREPSPRPGASALALAVVNGHFELAAILLDSGADPNATVPGWTALHAISWVRKPGVGDNDPAPQGSGAMTSLELVRKLVEKGANINARMTKRVNVGLTRLNTLGATPFLLAARTLTPC